MTNEFPKQMIKMKMMLVESIKAVSSKYEQAGMAELVQFQFPNQKKFTQEASSNNPKTK